MPIEFAGALSMREGSFLLSRASGLFDMIFQARERSVVGDVPVTNAGT